MDQSIQLIMFVELLIAGLLSTVIFKPSIVNNYYNSATEKSRIFKTFKVFNCIHQIEDTNYQSDLIEGNRFDINQNFQLVTLMEGDLYKLNGNCLGIQEDTHDLISMRPNSDSVIMYQNKFMLHRPTFPKDIPEDNVEQLQKYWKEYNICDEKELYGIVMLH